ncbi:nuclear transport factor 2 family protein [Streptomyces sp. NBC_00365]|uniref:nuclear transport factor 2 family protein n=1 Tax=Streptomyces sp. NBC_00365 TaxID=2975726 RepID=UPI0022501CB8|nr:nuclear transport factor 2 family protein [Streptomyces sp. NBC_00365]MCX5091724.1 nuclear transport factor 2 family protein [Streptomyces sp. NBC_00365]
MQPTNEDTVEIARVLALWGHLMDDRELGRLGEVLTEDAEWDGSVFGFAPVVGLEAITSVLSADGHASAHHTTNIVVSEGPGDGVRVRSKALGLVGGTAVSAVYADELRRTADGWRISKRVIQVK